MPGTVFAAVGVALLIAHNVGDHWVQSGVQAATKGQRTWAGRRACAAHVATYTATTAATVFVVWKIFDLPITLLGFVAGQAVSAITHYWADRRFTLARLAGLLGKTDFYTLGQPRRDQVEAHYPVRVSLPGREVLSPVTEHIPVDQATLGTGAYALDQSWHWAWLGVAAILTAVI